MNVIFDVDGVLIDWVSGFRAWMEAKGHRWIDSPNAPYDLRLRWPELGGEKVVKEIRNFNASPQFHFLKPIPGASEAVEAVAQLSIRPNMIAVTSSGLQGSQRREREKWLLSRGFHQVVFLELGESKHRTFRMLRPGVVFEDSVTNAREAATHGHVAVLFDQPWNRGEEARVFPRVMDWSTHLDNLPAWADHPTLGFRHCL